MAEGIDCCRWNHTAAIIATLVNINRDPKKQPPAMPGKFHPYYKTSTGRVTSGIPIKAHNIRILKKLFVDKKGQKDAKRLRKDRAIQDRE